MLSRVSESLYWMSRYLERAEHTARVINIQFNLMIERGTESGEDDWARVLRSLGIDLTEDDSGHAHDVALSLLHDPAHKASITASIMAARENARQVREQISSEMWEQLNRLFHAVRRSGPTEVWESRDFLQSIKDGAHLFQGITDATMTHNEGWQFIQAGRFLERTAEIAILVGVHFREFHRPEHRETDRSYLEWIGLLRSCTAFEAYCKAYTADLIPRRVAELDRK